MLQKLNGNM